MTVTDEIDGTIESNYDKVVDNFENMNLKENLLRGIYAYGFERPSAIQQRAIMPVLEGWIPFYPMQLSLTPTAQYRS